MPVHTQGQQAEPLPFRRSDATRTMRIANRGNAHLESGERSFQGLEHLLQDLGGMRAGLLRTLFRHF